MPPPRERQIPFLIMHQLLFLVAAAEMVVAVAAAEMVVAVVAAETAAVVTAAGSWWSWSSRKTEL